jgi:hypothetical protein
MWRESRELTDREDEKDEEDKKEIFCPIFFIRELFVPLLRYTLTARRTR